MKPLALIGMSRSGKTYWSTRLARLGWNRICCDDLIEAELASELSELGLHGLSDIGKWMGQPYESHYALRAERYLSLERAVMKRIIAQLATFSPQTVIDTTGSVIYTDADVCQALREQCCVVNLDTPSEMQREMLALYLRDTPPVIWGDSFLQESNQTISEALAASYPRLLAYRTDRYKRLAHITLPYSVTHAANFTVDDFLNAVLQHQQSSASHTTS